MGFLKLRKNNSKSVLELAIRAFLKSFKYHVELLLRTNIFINCY